MTIPTLVNSRSAIPVQAERMMRLEDRLVQLESQIATGEKFTEPAEAPPEALRAAMLDRMEKRLDTDSRVLQRTESRLSAAETAAAAASDLLFRASELALLAANGTHDADSRNLLLVELNVLRGQLADVANSRDDQGRALFAGAGAGPAYVQDANGAWAWNGSGVAAGAEGAGLAGLAPPTGPQLFGSDADGAFAALDRLAAAIAEPDTDLRNAALADSIDEVQQASDRLIAAHATIGGQRGRIEAEQWRIGQSRLDLAKAQRDNSGIDITAAIAELSAIELTLNAARAAFTRIHSSTLFDQLA